MNHGANLTLLEMDTNARINDPVAQAKRERRRQIVGPQSGEAPGLHSSAISKFVHVRAMEIAASVVIAVVIAGGVTSAALLA